MPSLSDRPSSRQASTARRHDFRRAVSATTGSYPPEILLPGANESQDVKCLALGHAKAPPCRGGDLGPPRHISPDRGLADLDAELKQFPMDTWRAPQRIGLAHAADQITNFCAYSGSSWTA